VEGAAKRPRKVRVVAAVGVEEFPWVAAAFYGLALEAGMNKNISEMTAGEIGKLLFLMAKRHQDLNTPAKSDDDGTEH
jgi:hypothetical protein